MSSAGASSWARCDQAGSVPAPPHARADELASDVIDDATHVLGDSGFAGTLRQTVAPITFDDAS